MFQLDRRFGQLVLERGWIGVDQLEDAILEQERLRRVNLRFRLGEILVRTMALTVSQVREILVEQGLSVHSCEQCEAVVSSSPGESHDGVDDARCPFCGSALCAAVFLETVRGDAP